jgi:hypothetical protein
LKTGSLEDLKGNNMRKEIFVSTDIEADGKFPGMSSMLSFASYAVDEEGNFISSFEANLHQLPDAKPDSMTLDWWSSQPEAWAACRENIEHPEIVFPEYVKWLESLGRKVVFVGYPATYDFTWIYYYLLRFTDRSPFGFSALDIKSYAMAVLGSKWSETNKRLFPKSWFAPNTKHTHKAIDDAKEQALLFINILKASRDNARSSD